MVRNQRPIHTDINQTMRLRREAACLLRRLQANQQAHEQFCADTGKRDAMRFITGCSAIERAIETTRGMIRSIDDLLQEVADQLGDPDCDFTANHVEHEHIDLAPHETQLVQSR